LTNEISTKCGIQAAAYHGGLAKKERQRVQEGFPMTIPVVVATVAFGMGIDVSNVRFVIHWNMPKSLEAFSQESGRAGRDGLPSFSIMYYDQQDSRTFLFLLNKEQEQQQQAARKMKNKSLSNPKLLQQKLRALEQMKEYCMTAKCRRNCLVNHFGGEAVSCNNTCDYCSNEKKVRRDIQSVLVSPARQSISLHKSTNTWDGQWGGPHDGGNEYDCDKDAIARDWGDDVGYIGDLKVIDRKIRNDGFGAAGFTKASSLLGKKKSFKYVLDKYEVRFQSPFLRPHLKLLLC
jgi:superfamily II DNA/RNA helicase